jgi:four helix bundle protein
MDRPSQLRVLDAAREVVRDINRWLRSLPRSYPDAAQLREAAGSITANIREAYGREVGPDRNKFLRYARSSAEETDEWLYAAWKDELLEEPLYWRLHNRLIAICRMLTSLMRNSGR